MNLHYACCAGSLELVKLLFEKFPLGLRAEGNEVELPLHRACFGSEEDDRIPIRKYLVEKWPIACLMDERYYR